MLDLIPSMRAGLCCELMTLDTVKYRQAFDTNLCVHMENPAKGTGYPVCDNVHGCRQGGGLPQLVVQW